MRGELHNCPGEIRCVYENWVGPYSRHRVMWCEKCGGVEVNVEEQVVCGNYSRITNLAPWKNRISGDEPLPAAELPVKEQVSTGAQAKARPVNDPKLHELYGVMKPHRGWSGAS